MTRDPFPNNWKEVSDTPSERFVTPLYQDILDRASCWELPDEYSFIIRVQNLDTLEVMEKAYRCRKRALKFIQQNKQDGNAVTCYTDDNLYSYTPDDA